MAKRKRSTAVQQVTPAVETPVPLPPQYNIIPNGSRVAEERVAKVTEDSSISVKAAKTKVKAVTNGRGSRASLVASKEEVKVAVNRHALSTVATSHVHDTAQGSGEAADDDPGSPLSELSDAQTPKKPVSTQATSARTGPSENAAKENSSSKGKRSPKVKKESKPEQEYSDPEAEDDEVPSAADEIAAALSRPPPVHSDYLPLPWKGRLGYACLCTYLRYSNPPVFSSRTCRIASIMERRHPLKDPDMPHHPTKNRPDRDQTPDFARGQAYVEDLGLANAKDIVKMIKWNDKFGIKFLRLSSEMFPFASHEEYGYKLAPFASEVLAEAGSVAAKLGHRLTTHPGQFTQLGSPRKEVIANSIRDLEYHAELLSLLKLPPQLNRDAVMILHMGGVFGDKEATLDRFRKNYQPLSQNIKNRLVLENDDVSWSVHELLPICEELNIPLVLDFHHHNIIHSDTIREGTLDIMSLYDRIKATWTRKGITQKMHYSEPEPKAITGRQRRKHSPRVATLPPCDPNMDLMIEAKDKEQAVFELMRTFKLPGWNTFSDIIPHVRVDENKPEKVAKKAAPRKKAAKEKSKGEAVSTEAADGDVLMTEDVIPAAIHEEEIGMGGPDGRVYWPPGMEEWLRPVKRVVKKKDADDGVKDEPVTSKKRKVATKDSEQVTVKTVVKSTKAVVRKAASASKKASKKEVLPTSDPESPEDLPDDSGTLSPIRSGERTAPARKSARSRKINYAETD